MAKPILCSKCGSSSIVECIDGQRSTTTFNWDKTQEKYIKISEDVDGDGNFWLECANCGTTIEEHEDEIREVLLASI